MSNGRMPWWGGWNARLGGDANRGLTLVVGEPDLSTVIAAGSDSILRFRHWNGSIWNAWTTLNVEQIDLDGRGIDAVLTLPDRIDLVVRDSQGNVRQTFGYADAATNQWAPWRNIGPATGPPIITMTDSGRSLQIFALGPNGKLCWKRWANDGWIEWDAIRDRANGYPRTRNGGKPPLLVGSFAAVSAWPSPSDRIDVIARTTNGDIVHTYWNGEHWAGFEDISGPLAASAGDSLAAVSPAANTPPGSRRIPSKKIDFFGMRLPEMRLYWKRWDDGWRHDWVPFAAGSGIGLRARARSLCRTDIVGNELSNQGVVYGYTRCDTVPAVTADAPATPLTLYFQNMALLVGFPGNVRAHYKGWDRQGAIRQLIAFLRARRFDVVGLAEVFHDDERIDVIADSLVRVPVAHGDVALYDPRNRREGPGTSFWDFGEDGGLLLLSRHEIVEAHDLIFDACSGITADCRANKGILHARIRVEDHPVDYDIFLTHMQNDNEGGPGASRDVTLAQATELGRFIQAHTRDVAYVMGDFNLDAFDSAIYAELRRRLPGVIDLWLTHGEGPGITVDDMRDFERPKGSRPIDIRRLETRMTNGHRIDYMFMWTPRRDSVALEGTMQVVTQRFTPTGAPFDGEVDLSDHYGIAMTQTRLERLD